MNQLVFKTNSVNFSKRVFIELKLFLVVFTIVLSIILIYSGLYRFLVFDSIYIFGILAFLIEKYFRCYTQIINVKQVDDNVYFTFQTKNQTRKIYIAIEDIQVDFVLVWPRVYCLKVFSKGRLALKQYNYKSLTPEEMEYIFNYFKKKSFRS